MNPLACIAFAALGYWETIGVLVGVGILGLVLLVGLVKRILKICEPNEVLIFSGNRHRTAEGKLVGYKTIKGGRKFRIPLLETVDRMDLTNMSIDVSVRGAFSKGGIPLTVQGVANVKVAGEEPMLDNAIERLLGKKRDDIMTVAKDTLEGNLRGVLAKMTPEEVNEDKIKFSQMLVEEAEHDLTKLGLMLDTLKIQNVTDDVGYLDSIGRIKTAEIKRDALVAEARARAASTVRDAENRQDTELARIDAEIRTTRAETERRIADALTKKDAMVAESRGQIAAAIAKAGAEIEVQTARVEQVRRQLQADVIAPASAACAGAESKAKGEAARIVEQGRAQATALSETIAAWRQAGVNARDVFLMQKLGGLTRTVLSTIDNVEVSRLTLLGVGGDGKEGAPVAARLLVLAEQLKATLGIDVVEAVKAKLGPAAVPAAARTTTPPAPKPAAPSAG
ncbi:MAG: flotillin family protein [Deltaproteobacteria bacterium]|nr:flotillin family protein [Deltaproteobacteria bacterium]